jgi:hypothetical protein
MATRVDKFIRSMGSLLMLDISFCFKELKQRNAQRLETIAKRYGTPYSKKKHSMSNAIR